MKKIILAAAAMLAVATSYAGMHQGSVPDAVLQAFTRQYPQQSVRKWEFRHDTCVAEFTTAHRKQSAYFAANGEWIKTETKLPWTKDLPGAVKESWKESAYSSWQIDKVDEVKTPVRESYTIVVYRPCGPEGSIPGDCEDEYKLYFTPDGSLYRQRKIE